MTAMRLEMMTADDVELRLRTETDPVMMAELGGPRPPEDIKRAHVKPLVMAAEGRCWPLKAIPDGSASAAGFVDVDVLVVGGATVGSRHGADGSPVPSSVRLQRRWVARAWR
jgi:hypothetical protein